MKFVTVAKCGRLNIDDVRNNKFIDAYLSRDVVKKLCYYDKDPASSCIDCINATIQDEISKYGNKSLTCPLYVLQDGEKLPSYWINM